MNDKIYILAMLNLICKKLKISYKDIDEVAFDIEREHKKNIDLN